MSGLTPAELVARLHGLDAATVHEAAGRTGDLHPDIRPIQQGVTLAGRAVTAACQPGDNLAIHRALLTAEPGDVLVVEAGGHLAGYWGELLAVAAIARGIAGLVIDGGCRDTAALRRHSFPVWSAGVSVHGTVKAVRGTINEPIVVGGVAVSPGDYVLADDDGVVIIAADRMETVLAAAQARTGKEAGFLPQLAAGVTTIDLLGLAAATGDG